MRLSVCAHGVHALNQIQDRIALVRMDVHRVASYDAWVRLRTKIKGTQEDKKSI